ncbi:DUF2087 domain-containing protein [Enterococcus hulanensis]|uniref:DUF2087 domain-containing protein n=1 Tax=Enterococcus hulanensis TaxID=2559929 RepID=A0ABU3F517_9ENTE|nr:DUF2087 domain-containing protein [Enterococcus hulanensis]MDT2602212.1 DUF2087 domain-containing protein [Enterococcus hulanensis]MDT2611607.1 DUF2087 domain-containing protein [Enterococcus hulanensis]MDT2618814.1 DUF2087 domain-containing protein [Enterococcus hulanensis]MDT2630284.1 DUF2087 domain-containing protein [Enterococcus hulanensis]MDT2657803.1 DUF2087 domain-containing protein [Enterococcus hulanensis]
METELTIEEIKKGYSKKGEFLFQCLYCDQTFDDRFVYPISESNSQLARAEGAMIYHLKHQHDGPFEALLNLDKNQSGLSDTQKNFLTLFSKGIDDQEIADQLNITTSAVRNHRFKFREKKRQAKILLALLESIEEKEQDEFTANSLIDSDERFISSKKEREKVFDIFLDENGKAVQIPKKEKKRIILLQRLAESFASEKQYTEKQVNEIISEMFEDFVTIRRYLIEYGILGRTVDGTIYWKI